jgi:hypothetical protein
MFWLPNSFASLEDAKACLNAFACSAGFRLHTSRSRFRADGTHSARSVDMKCTYVDPESPKLGNGRTNYSCTFEVRLRQHANDFPGGREGCPVEVMQRNLYHNHEMLSSSERTAQLIMKDTTSIDLMTKLKAFGFNTSEVRRVLKCVHPDKTEAIELIPTRRLNQISSPTSVERDLDSHELLQLLGECVRTDPDFFFRCDIEPTSNRLLSLFWMTSHQRHCYRTFHDVVSMDTKYRTNRYCKPFASLVTESSYGTTLILCQALLVDEKTETFEWLFQCLLEAVLVGPQTIFTDGDPAMAAAILRTLPDSKHRLCQWHQHRNVLKNLGWLGSRLSNFIARWTALKNEDDVRSVDKFDAQWTALLGDFELKARPDPNNGAHRFISDLYNSRLKWALRYVHSSFHGHLNSTQRSESMNAQFQSLLTSQSSLVVLFTEVNAYVNLRIRDFARRVEGDRAPVTKSSRMYENDLRNQLTTFAVREVMSQYDEAQHYFCEGESNDGLIVRRRGSASAGRCCRLNPEYFCSCQRIVSMGLPCRHIIAAIMAKRGETSLPSVLFRSRWRKTEAFQLTDKVVNLGVSALPHTEPDFMLRQFIAVSEEVGPLLYQMDKEKLWEYIRQMRLDLVTLKSKVSVVSQTSSSNASVEVSLPNVQNPEVTRQKGRPKASRFKSFLEKRPKRRCGRCREFGHDKRKCKVPRIDLTTGARGGRFRNCGERGHSRDQAQVNIESDSEESLSTDSSTSENEEAAARRPRGRPKKSSRVKATSQMIGAYGEIEEHMEAGMTAAMEAVTRSSHPPCMGNEDANTETDEELKAITSADGGEVGHITLYKSDVDAVKQVGRFVRARVVAAFSQICKKCQRSDFTGFGSPSEVADCHPHSSDITKIKEDIAAGKSCLQALYAADHFVLSLFEPSAGEVVIFDSLDGYITDHLRLQLWTLYGSQSEPLQIRLPIVNMQGAGSNNCGPMACAFMAEVACGGSPENVAFTHAQGQRDWMLKVLIDEELTPCPRRGNAKFNVEWTACRPKLTMTSVEAEVIRDRLTKLPKILCAISPVRGKAYTNPESRVQYMVVDSDPEDDEFSTANSQTISWSTLL